MKFLLRLSIRYKIMAIALIGILGLSVYLFFSIQAQQATEAQLDKIENVIFPTIERVDRSGSLLFKLRNQLGTALSEEDVDLVNEAELSAQKLDALLTEIIHLNDKDQDTLQLQKAYRDYKHPSIALARGMLDGSIDFTQLASQAQTVNQSYDHFNEALSKFRDQSYSNFAQSIKTTNEQNKQTSI
ncbi:MAG: hypothetical protein KBT75_18250, partial [Oleispira antarctica]|nr:hypothetical protein [Oleispira antarctica]